MGCPGPIWGGAPGKTETTRFVEKVGKLQRVNCVFAALAVVAKDKLGFWSSRAEGASGACFLFCYFFAARMRRCAVQSLDSRPSSRSGWQRRGFGERKELAAECRCRGLAGLGFDVCLLGQKQLGVCVPV